MMMNRGQEGIAAGGIDHGRQRQPHEKQHRRIQHLAPEQHPPNEGGAVLGAPEAISYATAPMGVQGAYVPGNRESARPAASTV